MRKAVLAGSILAAIAVYVGVALAQLYNPPVGGTAPPLGLNNAPTGALIVTSQDQAAGPLPVAQATAVIPAKGTMTFPGCVVGTTSAQCLAAAAATTHIGLQNVSSGTTNIIACNFGGAAILNDKSSFMLVPIGGSGGPNASNYGGATGIVPQGALSCIATAAGAQLYIEVN